MLDLNHGSGCQYQAPTRDPGITVAVKVLADLDRRIAQASGSAPRRRVLTIASKGL